MFHLWLEYFEVPPSDIDLVMCVLREHLQLFIFSKTLPPLNQKAFF